MLRPPQLTQASFLQKNQMLQNFSSPVSSKIRHHFRNKSHSILKLSKMYFTKNVVLNWYSSMKMFFRKIWTFFDVENWLWMSRFHDFRCNCAISDIKKTFLTYDFFLKKMKLVSSVWVSTSLSKSSYLEVIVVCLFDLRFRLFIFVATRIDHN